MPVNCMNNFKLRKIIDFEDLCKAMQVDHKGRPHQEIKIFVWDEDIKALLLVNKFYYEEERVGTVSGRIFDVAEEDIFIEDFEG